jgi:hypothetical protein
VSAELERALRSDLALAGLEEHLIRRAGVLYQIGFNKELNRPRITPSQMAVVGEYMQSCKPFTGQRAGHWLPEQSNGKT